MARSLGHLLVLVVWSLFLVWLWSARRLGPYPRGESRVRRSASSCHHGTGAGTGLPLRSLSREGLPGTLWLSAASRRLACSVLHRIRTASSPALMTVPVSCWCAVGGVAGSGELAGGNVGLAPGWVHCGDRDVGSGASRRGLRCLGFASGLHTGLDDSGGRGRHRCRGRHGGCNRDRCCVRRRRGRPGGRDRRRDRGRRLLLGWGHGDVSDRVQCCARHGRPPVSAPVAMTMRPSTASGPMMQMMVPRRSGREGRRGAGTTRTRRHQRLGAGQPSAAGASSSLAARPCGRRFRPR